jgi:ABC-2 type transport system ATP-binding protein
MKRKVALLSVLVPRVPLVILDEPTNALDPTMRDELLGQLREARDRGQAVLFSSHVLAEVERVCDRVGILQRGRLAHEQPLADLLEERRVQVRFRTPPAVWPDLPGLAKPAGQGDTAVLSHRGPVGPLLDWLGRQPVEELRIEPAGLAGVYARYHGGEE